MARAAGEPAAPNDRFRLPPAPAGLRFVQDLVNTALAASGRHPRPDLLSDLGPARSWLSDALGAWSAATGSPPPAIDLDESDLAALRDHREVLRAALRATPGGGTVPSPLGSGASRDIAAKLLLTVTADGVVRYEPAGVGLARGPSTDRGGNPARRGGRHPAPAEDLRLPSMRTVLLRLLPQPGARLARHQHVRQPH